jgi:phage gp16-like protein
MTDDDRRAMLAKIHIARKDLGLDEDTYRALVARLTRQRTNSAGQLSHPERADLLAEFHRLGWKPRTPPNTPPNTPPGPKDSQAQKIRALWWGLARAGLVRDPSEQALRAYVVRMTGKSDLRFCLAAEKSTLIEALKAWAERENAEAP